VRIGIISNISNQIGLEREFRLLKSFLEEREHEVIGVQFDEPAPDAIFDICLFLETFPRHLLDLSALNFIWPNPEWTPGDTVSLIRKYADRVFSKTREGQRIFEPLFPGKVSYTGFLATDKDYPSIVREKKFLHIGGNSSLRGTQAIVDAFKWLHNGKSLKAQLTIVSKALQDRPEIEGITYHDWLSDDEIRRLQNSHQFHIYPSATEGFGHALREALSVNATILTTDAPPMNELKGVYKIPAKKAGKRELADLYEVSAIDLHSAMESMLQLGGEGYSRSGIPRQAFLDGNREFVELFSPHLESLSTPRSHVKKRDFPGQLHISFMGNFHNPESTENMVKWALEQGLGHEVEAIEEKTATLAMLQRIAFSSDVFIWIRTPNWLKIQDAKMLEFLDALRAKKIPSCFLHLDKFFSIPDREAGIGVLPFWRCEHVFTADGSRDEDFKKREVNHHWMKPAVSETYCHPGFPRDEYKCDVGFVGARGYHLEYDFRPRLIDFLEKEYGQRFKHIEGLRGHGLNDFYASCKVTVGDCIFAGIPRYWSDRVPETCGRFGFLLHPKIPGLTLPLATYEPQNLENLKWQIEYWLARPVERNQVRKATAAKVAREDTCTVRMSEILSVVKP
jgi:hypothetical protein